MSSEGRFHLCCAGGGYVFLAHPTGTPNRMAFWTAVGAVTTFLTVMSCTRHRDKFAWESYWRQKPYFLGWGSGQGGRGGGGGLKRQYTVI